MEKLISKDFLHSRVYECPSKFSNIYQKNIGIVDVGLPFNVLITLSVDFEKAKITLFSEPPIGKETKLPLPYIESNVFTEDCLIALENLYGKNIESITFIQKKDLIVRGFELHTKSPLTYTIDLVGKTHKDNSTSLRVNLSEKKIYVSTHQPLYGFSLVSFKTKNENDFSLENLNSIYSLFTGSSFKIKDIHGVFKVGNIVQINDDDKNIFVITELITVSDEVLLQHLNSMDVKTVKVYDLKLIATNIQNLISKKRK